MTDTTTVSEWLAVALTENIADAAPFYGDDAAAVARAMKLLFPAHRWTHEADRLNDGHNRLVCRQRAGDERREYIHG